jgi:hypothetical protein
MGCQRVTFPTSASGYVGSEVINAVAAQKDPGSGAGER